MARYTVRRLFNSIPILVIVSALTFLGQALIPGDPLLVASAEGEALNPAALELRREELGLDKPLPIQYVRYVQHAVRGDFGRSLRTRQPVATMLRERLPTSIKLASITFAINVVMGIALGTIAALRAGWTDFFATTWAVLGVATPNFWVAILLVLVFSVWLGWLPTSGWVDPFAHPREGVRHLVLPVLALSFFGSATVMRQTRSSLLEVMREDYIATARSKGLSERQVVLRHAMRNSMLPVLTVIGLSLAGLVSGSVLIERVFAIPGVGRLAIDAASDQDYPVIQAIVLLYTVAIVVANLLTDLAYVFLDPRIRYT